MNSSSSACVTDSRHFGVGYFFTPVLERKWSKDVKNLLLQSYLIALPIILTALMGYVVWLLQEQKKQKKTDSIERDERIKAEQEQREANSRGTMLLLRVKLIEYHDRYMEKGNIPSYAYQNFIDMYDAYHKLGGNGTVTKMKQEIEELHLKKKGQNDHE